MPSEAESKVGWGVSAPLQERREGEEGGREDEPDKHGSNAPIVVVGFLEDLYNVGRDGVVIALPRGGCGVLLCRGSGHGCSRCREVESSLRKSSARGWRE